jgi:hypothetical protein
MAYHTFKDSEGNQFGSFEVWQDNEGWHWQACFPGCLPDGEPMGPFDTEEEAIEDAQAID